MTTQIVPGSLSAVSQRTGASIAESFLNADVIILVDTSGSMSAADARGGKKRYEIACQELTILQSNNPGKIAVISFSDSPSFCPAGIPIYQGGSTNLRDALSFVKPSDGTVRYIVISDGQPDDTAGCLSLAKTFESKIDCIFVGSESDTHGVDFLRRLAAASGGKYGTAEKAAELAETIERLMIGN